ncbi:hypothetical protein PGT21_027665 [Puccinia graminis f. sp. tritici]|uniref:Uncharacterized protein n=1 Tax=Puccinia graminis f. sp. tritici TaxID=56615 RepID=A0A5B0M5I3_PUCGR|nr:hypothetical protein PGT21_027665 [Puccinia graminis f. sp. tritici]
MFFKGSTEFCFSLIGCQQIRGGRTGRTESFGPDLSAPLVQLFNSRYLINIQYTLEENQLQNFKPSQALGSRPTTHENHTSLRPD